MTPILSICIPTYNRADILKKTLSEIVNNKGFDNDIEIVISDNCSTDHTQNVVEEFITNYSNIKYYRNEKNIREKNFWIALQRGQGEYVKLHNDYLSFTESGLQIIKENLHKFYKKQIFFSDNKIFTYKNLDYVECSDLNDYIKYISTYVTYIPLFGTWKENLSLINNPFDKAELKLPQVEWTYKILSNIKGSVIINHEVCKVSTLIVKGDYNWFEIHIQNYYDIMKSYINNSLISKKTYKKDISNALKHFKPELFYTFIAAPKTYLFEKKGSFKVLWKYCRKSSYFWLLILLYPFFICMKPLFVLAFKSNVIFKTVRLLYRKLLK